MILKPILKLSLYTASFLAIYLLPFSGAIVTKNQPLLAQSTKSEKLTLFVDPNKGDDLNSGTRNSPLQTITQALKIAESNTVISLAPGTYSAATGEKFPLIIRDSITLQGVLGGNGRRVVVMGGGSFISRTGAGQNVAIAATKQTMAIKGLTIINSDNRGHGLWVESANPEISHNTFTRNGNTGLSVNGRSKPLIANNHFRNNGGNGLLIYGQSAPTVTDNLFENTGFGMSLVQQSKALINDNEFRGNRIGLIFEGNSQGKLRGNRIINSWEYGLVAIANSRVDLGSSSQPGENIFRSNKKLAIQNITQNLISASGNQVRGATEGQIDFSDNSIAAVEIDSASTNLASNTQTSRLRDNPLTSQGKTIERSPRSSENQQAAINNPPRSTFNSSSVTEPTAESEVLPSPPVVKKQESLPPLLPSRLAKSPRVNTQNENSPNRNSLNSGSANSEADVANNAKRKEFVFTAPRSPRPLLPQTNRLDSSKPSRLPPPATSTQKPNLPLPPLKSPSVLGSNSNRRSVNSLSDLLGGSRPNKARFRVLVESNHQNQQKQILSLYPSAKRTVYQGKSMFQVGVFSDRAAAEKASRSLANLRLTSYILE